MDDQPSCDEIADWTDPEIDRVLSTALAVNPSAEFAARVRMQIIREVEPARWGSPQRFVIGAAAVVAIAVVVGVAAIRRDLSVPQTLVQREPLTSKGPASRLPERPQIIVPTVTSESVPRAASGFSRTVGSDSRTTLPEGLPEVLIDAGEVAALRRLFQEASEGRLDLATLSEGAQVTAGLSAPIEIEPIVVGPIGLVNSEGARQ